VPVLSIAESKPGMLSRTASFITTDISPMSSKLSVILSPAAKVTLPKEASMMPSFFIA